MIEVIAVFIELNINGIVLFDVENIYFCVSDMNPNSSYFLISPKHHVTCTRLSV